MVVIFKRYLWIIAIKNCQCLICRKLSIRMVDRFMVLRFNFQYKMHILKFFFFGRARNPEKILEKKIVCDSGI